MIRRLLADENLDQALISGLRRTGQGIDIVRVQDIGLSGRADDVILAWAAANNRVVVTHDVRTMTRDALRRVTLQQAMPGVIAVRRSAGIGESLADLLVVVECSHPEELENPVIFVPIS